MPVRRDRVAQHTLFFTRKYTAIYYSLRFITFKMSRRSSVCCVSDLLDNASQISENVNIDSSFLQGL